MVVWIVREMTLYRFGGLIVNCNAGEKVVVATRRKIRFTLDAILHMKVSRKF
jgi:hypothetical protein